MEDAEMPKAINISNTERYLEELTKFGDSDVPAIELVH